MGKVRYSLGCIALLIACLPTQKAFCSDISLRYIAQYKYLAIQEQSLTRIPASIKLAMALLESGSGQSYLATKGNNHFGIKWWNAANDGAAFIETFDDDKDRRGKPIVSRFIRFRSVEDSYRKHSDVLKRPRYAVLFTYLITDYRSWAYGLESCGYATARGYGARLIELIERYNLDQYDVLTFDTLGEQLEQLDTDFQIAATESHSEYQLNRPFNTQTVDQPDADFAPASDANSSFTTQNATKGTPQYKSDFEVKKAVFTAKKPVLTPSKPMVQSSFTNSQGEKVHYVLTEVE
jgi:hypothetical protein